MLKTLHFKHEIACGATALMPKLRRVILVRRLRSFTAALFP
jgi:hypothetical protein